MADQIKMYKPVKNAFQPSRLAEKFTHVAPKRQLSAADLKMHLADVDPMLLLMALVHVTRDFSLLDTFGPAIGKGDKGELLPGVKMVDTIAGVSTIASVSNDVRDEMIDLAISILDVPVGKQDDYLSGYDLDEAHFLRMVEMVVARKVDPEYFGMFLEQAGFVRPLPVLPQTGKAAASIELAILGAGMTGLAAAIQAKDRGFDFEIYEATGDVGGVWNLNNYPGVAVDTPAVYYSLSYEMNSDWTNYYPVGKEYFAYLKGLVGKYDLGDKINFNSEVLKIKWIDEDQEWELTIVKNGRDTSHKRAKAVMTCFGHLNRPVYPDLPGRETFKGQSMHANRWREDIDLKGKRVGIIGTGATGVQVIGKIAGEVGHLTVFQRQPMWIAPNRVGDGAVGEGKRWARKNLPYYAHWDRMKDWWSFGDQVGYPVVRVDPEWVKTSALSISAANHAALEFFQGYLHACFGKDSELTRKLTPDYAPLGKRIVRDPYDFAPGGFYYSLGLPHVDLETAKLARIVPDGILTVDGKLIELDVIIYATGLSLDWLSPIEVIGRDGMRLATAWRDNNPSSYLGGMVPGFPNLFVNSGPHTGAAHAGGHNFMAEVVNHYVMECLQLLVEEGARSLEVTQDAFDSYNQDLDAAMAGSIWKWERRAHTYYTNQKGRPILPTPWRHVEVWKMTRRPDRDAFIVR